MAKQLQIRKGNKVSAPRLQKAELGYAQDTNELLVGTDVGNKVIHQEKFDEINEQLADITTYPSKYGGKGDGVSNDTTHFQNALNNAPEGSVVDLEGKNYAVTGVIISKKIHLKNGTLTLLNSATKSAIEIASTVIGAEISNVTVLIDKVNIAATDASGIFINGATDTIIRDCTVVGSKNTNYVDVFHSSIYAHEANGVTIINCFVKNSDKEGIMTRRSDDVWIENCKAFDTGYSGIGTSGGARTTITGCKVFRTGTSSITVNSKDAVVSNNTVKDNLQYNGIVVGHSHEVEQYAENCVVVGNRIINSAGTGIMVTFSNNATITGNTITDVVNNGIYLNPNPSKIGGTVVSDNTIQTCGGRGIVYSVNAKTTLLIADNTIVDCTGLGLQVNTDGDVTISNNIIKNVNGGLQATGYINNGTILGTMDRLIISNNQFISMQLNAISVYNLSFMRVNDNVFHATNLLNNTFAHVINVQGTVNSVNYPMPDLIIENNSTKATSSSSKFVNIGSNAYDAVVHQLKLINNLLPDFAPANILVFTSAQVTHQIRGNKIGEDSTFVFVSIGAGATTTTITNSNIHAFGGLPVITPRTNNLYIINPYVSSFGNGTLTLTHAVPSATTSFNVTFI